MATDTKRLPDVACKIDAKARTVMFTFADGLQRIGVSADDLTADVLAYAALHGLKQRIGDAAAIPRDTKTGKSATIADKRNAMIAVVNTLMNGEWSARREGGDNEGGLLLRALEWRYPVRTREALQAWVNAKSKANQNALRTNPKIAAIIAELRAEQGKGIDTDAMLDELDD